MLKTVIKITDKLIDTTGNAVETLATLFDSAAKIKRAVDTAQIAGDPDTVKLIMALVSEVQNTKFANLDLKQQLLDLREEAIKAQDMENQFDRYELKETQTGAIVLSLKKTDTSGEPHHYICPTCQSNGKKSILQGHEGWRKCNTCNAEYPFKPQTIMTAPRDRRTPWDY